MSFVSYAQNFEDVMLWRALGHVQGGRYLDIGAQDPVDASVSLAFYEHGWRGMHVEPNLRYAEMLRKARPDEAVLEVALGTESGIAEFFDIEGTGLSTLQPEIAEQHRQAGFGVASRLVPMLTLDEVLARFNDAPLHWLKIDVEGAEKLVLEGWRQSPVRPWVLVVESTLPLSQQESHSEWESLVLGKGYRFAYFDGLNRFYVAEECTELLEAFRHPPCVFDDFALVGTQGFCHTLTARATELERQVQTLESRVRFLDAENERRKAALVDHRQALDAARQQIEREIAEHARTAQQASANEARLIAEYAELEKQASANEARLIAEYAEFEKQASANEARLVAEYAEFEKQASANEARLVAEYAELGRQALANEANLRADYERLHREACAERDRWQAMAEDRESRFAALVQSRSWRITRPLRGVHRLLRGEYALARRTRHGLRSYAKRLLRPLLLGLMRRALARPAWRSWFVRQTHRWPGMHRRLREIAQNAELIGRPDSMASDIAGQSAHLRDSGTDLDAVPFRVRMIYAQLQQAQRSAGRQD